MKNKDKLKVQSKNHVRYSILYYGSWSGVIKQKDGRYILAIFSNVASINNPNFLEFYKQLT